MTIPPRKHLVVFSTHFWGAFVVLTVMSCNIDAPQYRTLSPYVHARRAHSQAASGPNNVLDRSKRTQSSRGGTRAGLPARRGTPREQDKVSEPFTYRLGGSLKMRRRVIALEEGIEADETSGAPVVFKAVWDRLCNDQPLTCAKTGTRFEAFPVRPSAALLDVRARISCNLKSVLTADALLAVVCSRRPRHRA